MSERRFNILFSGQAIDGHELAQVRENMQQLFKLDNPALDKLFTGQTIAIKKNLDRKTAIQYQTALTKAGANIQVVMARETPADPSQEANSPSDQNPSANHTNADNTSAQSTTTGDNPLTLKPAGSDLLDNSERKPVVQATIETEHIQLEKHNPFLDNAFSPPKEASDDAGTYPANDTQNAPTWSVAQPGSLLVEAAEVTPTQPVVTSYLDIDPLGVNLVEAMASMPAPELKHLDTLTLAVAGEDLLKPDEKASTPPVHINTDHLSTE